ncbi:response regulator [Omnitrophica bacterium]|nr:response regulator [Candidatus Omnitrophota bacterium]
MKKIVIIDDEKAITAAFKLCLSYDYQVYAAHTGQDGLTLIEKEKPDLIVLDWRLNSEVEGKEVLRYVKEYYPQVPAVVVTASIYSVDEIKTLGPAECILKPCPDLKDKIMALLPP